MQLPARLLQRKPDSHKADFGHILILAGSLRYSGAAFLCSLACMRTGAGMVTLGIPVDIALAITKNKPKELMLLPLAQTKSGGLSLSAYKKINDFIKKVDILVIGPGLGLEVGTQRLIRKLVLKVNKPLVIDADGINALVGKIKFFDKSKKEIIITPHPKEMSRLCNLPVDKIQADRVGVAVKFANKHKVVVVLKGNKSIVAAPRGEVYINKTGNPGMATAGSGDVLAGMIAALLGQGLNSFEAAKFGVYLHGLAGDIAAREKGQISLIASDIIDKISDSIKVSS